MRGRYLYSHVALDEALAKAKALPGANVDEASFRAWWVSAQKRLAEREPVWSSPIERELPPGCEAYVAEMKALKLAASIGAPWEVRVVDLRRVVAYQEHIVEDKIALPKDLDPKDPCALLRFALHKPEKAMVARQDGPNEFTLSASDPNVRVLGNAVVDDPVAMTRVLGFAIGTSLPWILVVAFQGRHVLRDGYHRAVALLRAGIYEVPVARVEASDVKDLGIDAGQFLPRSLVLGPQPPLLTDFLDDRLAQNHAVYNLMRVIRITAEQFLVPVSEPAGDSSRKN